MVHTTFTNNMRSDAILRKEIIKGFARSAHIKRKHNKATGSTEKHVTVKGTELWFLFIHRKYLKKKKVLYKAYMQFKAATRPFSAH